LEINEKLDIDHTKYPENAVRRITGYEEYFDRFGYLCSRIISKEIFNLPDGWKVKPDGSCGGEFVSPPLLETDTIHEVCRLVEDARSSNKMTRDMRNTGMHVHVDATDLCEDKVLAVAQFCRHFDRAIFSFVNKNR